MGTNATPGKERKAGRKIKATFPLHFPYISPKLSALSSRFSGVRNLRILRHQNCRHGDADAPSPCLSLGCAE